MEGSTEELGSSQSEEGSCSKTNKGGSTSGFGGGVSTSVKGLLRKKLQQKQSITSEEITIQRLQDELSKDGAVCEVINVS